METKEQLQAYTLQIVALGQAALAIYRRGDWLPEELAGLADDLLALEARFRPGDGGAAESMAPESDLAHVSMEEGSSEIEAEEPVAVGLAEDELAPLYEPESPGAVPAASALLLSFDENDDWLRSLDDEPTASFDHRESANGQEPGDDLLVLDVDEGPGGGPEVIVTPLDALPPLVVDAAADLPPVDMPVERLIVNSDVDLGGAPDTSGDEDLPELLVPDAEPERSVDPLPEREMVERLEAADDVVESVVTDDPEEEPPPEPVLPVDYSAELIETLPENAPTEYLQIVVPDREDEDEQVEDVEVCFTRDDSIQSIGALEDVEQVEAVEVSPPAMAEMAFDAPGDRDGSSYSLPARHESTAAGVLTCSNCGGTLRPGRRFCHHCGAPIPQAETPLSEMPTMLGRGVAIYASDRTPTAEVVRFCDHCGRGVAADVEICPECGGKDFS